ncbi:MAG: MauE/DoxX family redox-associated membrane protein [Flavobacterium sp.]
MKCNLNFKTNALILICYLYIFLFIYAAFSKLIDFQTFKVQLGQSPLLSAHAEWIVFSIPAIEIIISMLLIIPRFRYLGLLSAFGLMVMFTAYIIIILNYSSFIPCSCGGILSEMDWTQHLIFNIGFILLAIIGMILLKKIEPFAAIDNSNPKLNWIFKHSYIMHSIIIGCFSTIIIIILFQFSEETIHRNNSFVRRYPHHPITTIKGIPLNYNSYYIAGFANEKIYLGNSTAPLHLLSIDTTLKNTTPIRIQIADSKDYSFSSVQVRIKAPDFFISDGAVPIVYAGNTNDWTAKTILKGNDNFSLFEPTTRDNFVIRGNNKNSGEHVLGTMSKSDKGKITTAPSALQKKIDGIFDTDGMLVYNEELKKVIYMYYYRNSFIVSDTNLKSIYNGKTIDTVSQVPMEFAYLKSNTEKKFAKQPPMIQKFAASSGKYLFVKSDRLGKYESEEMIKQSSIVDVYDLQKHTYEFSFYLYHYENEEIKKFAIYGNLLIGLTKKHLVTCELKPKYFKLK